MDMKAKGAWEPLTQKVASLGLSQEDEPQSLWILGLPLVAYVSVMFF